jgi:hypothetical protein
LGRQGEVVNQTQKKPRQVAPHNIPKRAASDEAKEKVLAMADEIFDRYVEGESFYRIANSLPFPIKGWRMRDILMNSEETRETYENAAILRSHHFIERAIDFGRDSAQLGDASGYRVAIDTHLKVAAKINPREYGDTSKVELTGKNGRALEIKADLTLTAEQAYERLIKGE